MKWPLTRMEVPLGVDGEESTAPREVRDRFKYNAFPTFASFTVFHFGIASCRETAPLEFWYISLVSHTLTTAATSHSFVRIARQWEQTHEFSLIIYCDRSRAGSGISAFRRFNNCITIKTKTVQLTSPSTTNKQTSIYRCVTYIISNINCQFRICFIGTKRGVKTFQF